jgi:hypothetical protein
MTPDKMLEEGWEQRAKCPCGHLWIADHLVSGDQASCQFCSCVLEMWDPAPPHELTIQQFEELTRLMREGEK